MFLALITRLQVDGEDNNASRHLRNDSPVYAEMQRGLAPYTDLLGSTTRKLQRDVQQVKQAIEWLAPQHAHPMRRKQLKSVFRPLLPPSLPFARAWCSFLSVTRLGLG